MSSEPRTFSKGLFLKSCTFSKGLFLKSCTFSKGLLFCKDKIKCRESND